MIEPSAKNSSPPANALWGGRFAGGLAEIMERINASIDFDKRLYAEDKGRIVTAFLESFFTKYVGYDFTADLEEKT